MANSAHGFETCRHYWKFGTENAEMTEAHAMLEFYFHEFVKVLEERWNEGGCYFIYMRKHMQSMY